MKTNELKKGAIIRLNNGWYAEVYDNMKGNTRMCKVWGYETEIGSVYAHDIGWYFPTAKTVGDAAGASDAVRIEHTDAQKKLKRTVGLF